MDSLKNGQNAIDKTKVDAIRCTIKRLNFKRFKIYGPIVFRTQMSYLVTLAHRIGTKLYQLGTQFLHSITVEHGVL